MAGKLSLRNATEATYGALVCLAFFSEYGEAWKESDQLSVLKQHKNKIKKWLSKFGPCMTRLEALPESLDDLPTELQRTAFPDGHIRGHPSLMSLERLRRMIANFRLRDRKDGQASSLPVSASETIVGQHEGVAQLVTACAGLMRQATNMPASHITEPEPPRVRLYTKSPDPKGSASLLAIKDKEDIGATDSNGGACDKKMTSEQNLTPAQTISILQQELSTIKEASKTGKPKRDTQRMARPAAAKPASLKRPACSADTNDKVKVPRASKSGKETRKTFLRKPSAQASSLSRKEKEAIRKKMLAKIPKAVLLRYATECIVRAGIAPGAQCRAGLREVTHSSL